MAGGKQSPRQKMINMMYLVLTALLALNVSAEILKAFHLVEVSLDKSTQNIDTKNAAVMKGIEKYHNEFPNDVNGTQVFNNAKSARQIAGDLVKYIEDIKQEIIKGAEGRKEDSNGDGKTEDEELQKADDIEHHANMMINNKKGDELRARINDARTKLLALLPKEKQATVKSDLTTEDYKVEGAQQSWQSVMFEHTPAAAAITLLSKMQSDARNTEAQVLEILKSSISESDFTFDKLEAKVIPNNGTFITEGAKYSADIFVAASSSKQEAEIKVNGSAVKIDGGVGKYEVTASGEGEREYTAVITAKKPNGQTEQFTVKSKYTVLKPLAVISATKMNVVYRALDNPISVSVPGYSPKDVTATISSGGKLRPDKQPGTYICTVDGSQREVVISVSVKTPDGLVKKMGDKNYRVKAVPSPTPGLGQIEQSGPVSLGALKASKFVFAKLKDFVFEGVSYTVTGFGLQFIPKTGGQKILRATGNVLTPEMQAYVNNARIGDKFIFAEIKATGPNGNITLPSYLNLEVK